MINIVEFQL